MKLRNPTSKISLFNYKVPIWARRSQYYLMEFIAALIGLTVTTFLLDRALYAMARYLGDAQAANASYDQLNLWVVALLALWVPMTILFYKRSRFEELRRSAVAKTKLRRFFLYSFMLIMLVATLGFGAAAAYSFLLLLFGVGEPSDLLLQQFAPAVLASMLHCYIFRVFMRRNSGLRIKEFTFTFGLVSLVLFAGLVVMTSIQARGGLVDRQISKDLKEISRKVEVQYQQDGRLPSRLSDLGLDATVARRGQQYGYTYEKQSNYNYKLCAVFKTNGEGMNEQENILSTAPSIYPPKSSHNFYKHSKGKHCFALSVGFRTLPLNDTDPGMDGVFDSQTESSNTLFR